MSTSAEWSASPAAWVLIGVAGAGWLLWPGIVWAVWRLAARWRAGGAGQRARGLGLAIVLLLLAYMRFVEPQLIVERTTAVEVGFRARLAVVSDLHVGPYKGVAFVERLVERLNRLDVDAVLIAGDHLLIPHRPPVELLAPLRHLRHATYSVPGNHDEPPAETWVSPEDLRKALQSVGVRPIEYTHADLGTFTLVGLGDRFAGKDDLAPLHRAPRHKPVVVLAHNPDSAVALRRGSAALVVAGHTHGGQIRLPILYRWVIPTEYPFDRGMHRFTQVPVFVTSGVGEGGLPLRLFNPPVIDILELR